jgi:hypothetical protein
MKKEEYVRDVFTRLAEDFSDPKLNEKNNDLKIIRTDK